MKTTEELEAILAKLSQDHERVEVRVTRVFLMKLIGEVLQHRATKTATVDRSTGEEPETKYKVPVDRHPGTRFPVDFVNE